MNLFRFLFLFLTSSIVFSQSLPLDFESATTWTNFGGGEVTTIANPYNDSANPSANVGQMVKNPGEVYGGSFITLSAPMDFENNDVFSMKVYAPHTNTRVLLKVENATNSGINFEKERVVHNPGVWETIYFNYSEINTASEYSRIVIIFDNGIAGDGSAGFTYYFDDIALSEYGNGLTQMNLPVTFDDPTVDYGLIGFEGIYDNEIIDNPFIQAPNTTAKVAKVVKDASAGSSAGTTISNLLENGFSSPIPFSATETKMNLLVYSPDAGIPVRLKVEDHNDVTRSVETQVNTTTANQWEVLEFDFSQQATGTAALNLAYSYDKASIFFNFGTPGSTAGTKTYYFDDLKFGAVENAGVEDLDGDGSKISFYPNPATAGSQITFSNNVKSVDYYDLNGKKVMTSFGNFTIVSLPKGIYLLQITDENDNISNDKLIVK